MIRFLLILQYLKSLNRIPVDRLRPRLQAEWVRLVGRLRPKLSRGRVPETGLARMGPKLPECYETQENVDARNPA